MARPCLGSGQGQGGLGGFLPGGRKPKEVCEMDLLQVPRVTLAPLGPPPNPPSTPVFLYSPAASRWPWPPPLRESVNSDAKIKAPSSLLGSHGNLDLLPQLQSHEAGAKRGQQGAPPTPHPRGCCSPPFDLHVRLQLLPAACRKGRHGCGMGAPGSATSFPVSEPGGALLPLGFLSPCPQHPRRLQSCLAAPGYTPPPSYLLTHFREPQQPWGGGQLLALSCRRPPFRLGFGGLSPR